MIDRESLRPAFERWHRDNHDAGEELAWIDIERQWRAWCAAFESLGEPVGRLEIMEAVEVPGSSSAMRIKTRFVNVYRLPEVKA